MKLDTKEIKKAGFKGFKKRFKEGVMRITPQEQIYIEIVGYTGSIIGTIAAGVIFVLWGLYPIILFLAFNIVIQVSQLIGKYQQYQTFKQISNFDLEQITEVN